MKALLRWLLLVLLAGLALQLYFVARIGMMRWVDPQSTAFQRSEAWRIVSTTGRLPWRQEWVPYERIADSLKRAVLASEDDAFPTHGGIYWESIEKAWAKNAKAEEQAARRAAQARPGAPIRGPKIVGGSTITQQLAKNLFLSGERTLMRKGQEFVITMALEALLDKPRILEIYLNSVEWGEGVFGAEAAARHYFRKGAGQLGAYEAARLSVMLPRPKFFEKLPASGYLSERAGIIVGRMPNVRLP